MTINLIGSGLIDFESEDDSGWCRLDMKKKNGFIHKLDDVHHFHTHAGPAQQHEQKQRKNQGCDKDGHISAIYRP